MEVAADRAQRAKQRDAIRSRLEYDIEGADVLSTVLLEEEEEMLFLDGRKLFRFGPGFISCRGFCNCERLDYMLRQPGGERLAARNPQICTSCSQKRLACASMSTCRCVQMDKQYHKYKMQWPKGIPRLCKSCSEVDMRTTYLEESAFIAYVKYKCSMSPANVKDKCSMSPANVNYKCSMSPHY